jgi:hypothetical protein
MAPEPRGSIPDDRLMGWKEIAAYLHTCDRTAQRWERLGLPVRRIPTSKSMIVHASRGEIQEWLNTANGRQALTERKTGSSSVEDAVSKTDLANVTRQGSDGSGRSHTAEVSEEAGSAGIPGDGCRVVTGRSAPTLNPRRALAARSRILWLAAIGLTATMAVAWRATSPRWAAFHRPGPMVADSGSVPNRVPPGATALLRVTLTNGTALRMGSQEGTVSSLSVAGHPPLALSTRQTSDVLVLHIYLTSGSSVAGENKLKEIASMVLHRGQKQPAPDGSGLREIEWLKTLASPTPGETDTKR